MMPATILLLLAATTALATTSPAPTTAELSLEVADVERAFARTMAERDFVAFQELIADQAVFLGSSDVRRGKAAVAAAWERHFEAAEAPFSWRPETVEVLDSGDLAISTGPVFDAAGKRISTYTSIWRREPSGKWRIVFDKGDPYCE